MSRPVKVTLSRDDGRSEAIALDALLRIMKLPDTTQWAILLGGRVSLGGGVFVQIARATT